MKLFTVGDSISQGFMSLAAARTDLLYSTLIARAMGLKLGEEYSCPEWFGAHSDAVPRTARCPRNRVQPTTLLPPTARMLRASSLETRRSPGL
jgi:hypothetical protein